MITHVPFPNSLCTSILPPWDSTISFVMERPNPAPPLCLERDFSTLYNRSKIYGKSCLGIPSPSSVVVITISLAVCLTSIVIFDPSLECFCALSNIFINTCLKRSGSI